MPVFTKNFHRKPDISLDLYKDEIYWGSIIFEVKYRTMNNFWNSKETSSKVQIRAYRNDICWEYTANQGKLAKQIRPVLNVWVLYPSKIDIQKKIIDKEDESVKLVNMDPATDNILIIREMKKDIEYAFELY